MSSHYSSPGESKTLPVLFPNETDPADRLPTAASLKLKKLRDDAASLRAIALIPYSEAKDLADKKNRLAARIAEMTRRGVAPDDPLLIAEKETHERLLKKSLVLSSEADARRERASVIGRLVQNIELYLESIPATQTIESAPDLPTPKIKSGYPEAIETIRDRLQKHHREIGDAINAPIHSSEAKRRAANLINGIAANGTPDVIGLIEGGALEWPMKISPGRMVSGSGGGGFTESAPEIDTHALFCWLHRDQLIASINAEIDNIADDKEALNETARTDKIKAAKDALLTDSRTEEQLIVMAEAAGFAIERRENCDPRAVLNIIGPDPREDW